MSEQEQTYPPATKELAEQRQRLAPKPAEAFKAFSQSAMPFRNSIRISA